MSATNRSAELRIGDAEREAAVSALGEHYAAGRLTQAEFDQRSSQAYAARTNADLWPLFRDLPDLAGPGGSVRRRGRGVTVVPAPPPGVRHRGRWQGPLVGPLMLPLLLVVICLLVLTHLPWSLLLIVGWLWWGRMFRCWSHSYRGRAE